jgi:Fe-S cluster assembly protein SufB
MPIPIATWTAVPTKEYQYGFSDPERFSFKSKRGLGREVVEQISAYKNEPDWMLQFRLCALEIFQRKPLPNWPSADLSEIDFDNIFYYLLPTDNSCREELGRRSTLHQGHLR